MNKTFKHILLPASEIGWELWQLSKEELLHVKSIDQSLDTSVPKDTIIAFPANLVTTTALTIPSADRETQKGIAKLQLEQCGVLKPDSNSWDIYTVDKEIPLVTGVSLQDELVEGINFQLGQTFDLAARFYRVGDLDTIICKKEQGAWITIWYKDSNPFYVEHIDSPTTLLSQIKSILIPLALQGIPFLPQKIIIEGLEDEGSIEEEALTSRLEKEIGASVAIVKKIDAELHAHQDLNLIPSKIEAKRKSKQRAERRKLYLLAVACLYIIGGMILYKQHSLQEQKIQTARNKVDKLRPTWQAEQLELSKKNELENVLTNQWPLASFEKVVSHLPSHQTLRFQRVEIQASNILIKGVAPDINHINNLEAALLNDPYFKNYTWRTIEKNEDNKTKLWNFSVGAIKKEVE